MKFLTLVKLMLESTKIHTTKESAPEIKEWAKYIMNYLVKKNKGQTINEILTSGGEMSVLNLLTYIVNQLAKGVDEELIISDVGIDLKANPLADELPLLPQDVKNTATWKKKFILAVKEELEKQLEAEGYKKVSKPIVKDKSLTPRSAEAGPNDILSGIKFNNTSFKETKSAKALDYAVGTALLAAYMGGYSGQNATARFNRLYEISQQYVAQKSAAVKVKILEKFIAKLSSDDAKVRMQSKTYRKGSQSYSVTADYTIQSVLSKISKEASGTSLIKATNYKDYIMYKLNQYLERIAKSGSERVFQSEETENSIPVVDLSACTLKIYTNNMIYYPSTITVIDGGESYYCMKAFISANDRSRVRRIGWNMKNKSTPISNPVLR